MTRRVVFPEELIAEYLADKRNMTIRDDIVERAMPIVEILATALFKRKYVPRPLEADDLASEAFCILPGCVETFNPPHPEGCLSRQLAHHVAYRSRFHILTFLRDMLPISPTRYRKGKRFDAAHRELLHMNGYGPTLEEIAAHMGTDMAGNPISEESVDSYYRAWIQSRERPLRKTVHEEPRPTPHSSLDDFQDLLPPDFDRRERMIMILIYCMGHTLTETADALGFSNCWMGHIHKQLLIRVKSHCLETRT